MRRERLRLSLPAVAAIGSSCRQRLRIVVPRRPEDRQGAADVRGAANPGSSLAAHVPADSGITVVRTGVRIPRMNAAMNAGAERSGENSSTALIWNQHNLLQH